MAAAGVDIRPRVHEVHAVIPGATGADADVATVMAIYEAFGGGDVEVIVDQLDDDVDWEMGVDGHGIPWLEPGRGHDHVRRFFANLGQTVDLTHLQPGRPLTNENQVAVSVALAGQVKATGKQWSDDQEIHLWTFGSDGQVVAFKHVVDTHAHWLAMQP